MFFYVFSPMESFKALDLHKKVSNQTLFSRVTRIDFCDLWKTPKLLRVGTKFFQFGLLSCYINRCGVIKLT